MMARREQTQRILGYEAPILRGVWERPQRMGAPRLWSALWLVLCLWIWLMMMTVVGFTVSLIPLVVWALGQGTLIWLTKMDAQWDDLMFAHWGRRYKAFYEAG